MSRDDNDEDRYQIEIGDDQNTFTEKNMPLFRTKEQAAGVMGTGNYSLSPNAINILKHIDNMGIGKNSPDITQPAHTPADYQVTNAAKNLLNLTPAFSLMPKEAPVALPSENNDFGTFLAQAENQMEELRQQNSQKTRGFQNKSPTSVTNLSSADKLRNKKGIRIEKILVKPTSNKQANHQN